MQHNTPADSIPADHPLADDTLLPAMWKAAAAAAHFVRARAPHARTIDWVTKSPADFVSEVDLGAERLITAALNDAIPAAVVAGEEHTPSQSLDQGLVFVVDPLDGTTNFLHGFPHFAVSIGAVGDGALLAGLVWNVMRGEVFTAARGRGAYCGTEAVHVSTISDPGRALVGTGFPFRRNAVVEPYLHQLQALMTTTAGIRRPGAAALDLADVACGRFDAFWEASLAPWDIAAGLLLVREAGGMVTDQWGVDLTPSHTPVYASNGLLHPWLLSTLGHAVRPSDR